MTSQDDGAKSSSERESSKFKNPYALRWWAYVLIVIVAVAAVAFSVWLDKRNNETSPVATEVRHDDTSDVLDSPSTSLQSLVDLVLQRYAHEYKHVLGTPGADWIVGDMIASSDMPGYVFPVGDMTDWPATIEIVAGLTSEDAYATERSEHGYVTCDVQQGGSIEFVAYESPPPIDRIPLTLMQYHAPMSGVDSPSLACVGGEYFFPAPETVKKMMGNAFLW